jgi:hypothetical protein
MTKKLNKKRKDNKMLSQKKWKGDRKKSWQR